MTSQNPLGNLSGKTKALIGAGVGLGLLTLVMLMDGFFIVRQTESALVIRFGNAYREIVTPGLKIKAPFIDEVVRIDNRVLDLDDDTSRRGSGAGQQVILRDRRRIVVDTVTRYRITQPTTFYRVARTIDNLEQLLRNRTNAAVRDEMATVVLTDLLAGRRIRSSVLAPSQGGEGGEPSDALGPDGEPLMDSPEPENDQGEATVEDAPSPGDTGETAVEDLENGSEETGDIAGEDGLPADVSAEQAAQARLNREKIMENIQAQVAEEAERFGVEIVDVRIRRADLPDDVFENVLGRMVSERQRVAARLRAEGEEEAREIRSEADKQVEILRSEGQEQADRLRGQGEQESYRILGEAFSQDPEFYTFYRSMLAYRQALADPSTTLILDPNSEFFQYFDRTDLVPAQR